MEFDSERLESFIQDKMRETKIPGLSIALVRGEEVVYTGGFGFRDIDYGYPAAPSTVYGIGSVTKSFTALAVMQLVEEGKLSLDDPVEKHLSIKLRPLNKQVTIYHLLTHTSGIPALAYAEALIRNRVGAGAPWVPLASPEDILVFMRDAEEWAVSPPGTKFYYLNEGYVLLGLIISKTSSKRYEDYIREKILKPLEMKRTYFSKEEVDRDPDVATPYIVDKEGKHIPSRFPYGITSDGGLLSNVLDLAKYIAMYHGRGTYRGTEIVSRESIEIMERKHIGLPAKLFGDEGYGYGLSITEKFHGRKLVYHSGSVLVYTAYLAYLPGEKLGVAVLANSSGYPLSFIGLYALTLALGKDPEKHLEPLKKEKILKKLEGIYKTYKDTLTLQVEKKGDFLYILYRDKYTEQLTPLIPEKLEEEYAKFYTLSYGRRVEVEFIQEKNKTILLYERYKLVKQ